MMRVSPNDLRRTFASWCWQAGMQPSRIALLLGHRDARMVERVYGVLDADTLGRGDRDRREIQLPERRGHVAMRKAAGEKFSEVKVPGDGIEPPTRGFSVPCSTN